MTYYAQYLHETAISPTDDGFRDLIGCDDIAACQRHAAYYQKQWGEPTRVVERVELEIKDVVPVHTVVIGALDMESVRRLEEFLEGASGKEGDRYIYDWSLKD